MGKENNKFFETLPLPRAHGRRKRHIVTNTNLERLFAILLIVFGVLCIGFTDKVHSIFRYMLGGNMVAIGVCDLYRGIKLGEYRENETKLTSNGIIMILLGSIIVTYRGSADSIIGCIWGMIGLIKGSEELNIAIYYCVSKQKYVKSLFHAIIELLLAIMLLAEPQVSVKHHVVILGAELIWYGIQIIGGRRKKETLRYE